MAKLNQVLAIEKGIKSDSYSAMSELHKINQKAAAFAGFTRNYQSLNDDGDKLPAESKKVEYVATEVLKQARKLHTSLLNIIARKDWTNTEAKADVVVDGNAILKDVPVPYLLFLEKQMSDLHDLVDKMPVLDTAEDWALDANTGLSKAPEVKTHRTKKVEKPIVLYNATPEHPAQTKVISEDVIEGYWTAVKVSGALQRPVKLEMLERIDKLAQAVKIARESANMQDERVSPDVGTAIYDYVLPKEQPKGA